MTKFIMGIALCVAAPTLAFAQQRAAGTPVMTWTHALPDCSPSSGVIIRRQRDLPAGVRAAIGSKISDEYAMADAPRLVCAIRNGDNYTIHLQHIGRMITISSLRIRRVGRVYRAE